MVIHFPKVAPTMSILSAVLLCLLGNATGNAQQSDAPPPPVPLEERGLRVGEPLPKFELIDQRGRRQTFETLRGPKGLVLLFVRSADW